MKLKLTWIEIVLLAAPFASLAFFWNTLPARIPIHWNLHGEIDGWASKEFGLLPLPFLNMFLTGLLRFLPQLDPKLRRGGEQGRMPATVGKIRLALQVFLNLVFFLQIAASLGHDLVSGRFIPAGVLILFAILGNYLGNLRPNYFIGIRTPWTLESAETWRATHRLGGRLLVGGSIVLIVLLFLLPDTAFFALFTGATLALVAWCFLYSWRHFQSQAERR